MSIHARSKAEIFKKIFGSAETIRGIDENIQQLYQLAATPENKEAVADDVALLMERKNNLLKQQARFLSFMATLDPLEVKLLRLRCERNSGWKYIAAELHISDTTAKRALDQIVERAEKYGGIF